VVVVVLGLAELEELLHAAQVSELAAGVVETAFTGVGVETAQTWELVTIGAQLAAATGVLAAGAAQVPQVSAAVVAATGLLEVVEVDQTAQVSVDLLVATTGLLEVVEVQAPQVSVDLLVATTGLEVVVVVDQAPHVSVVVATTGLVVVVVVDVHWFHRSSDEDATAEAETAPTMVAAATTDFILIVLGGWFYSKEWLWSEIISSKEW
jgi:hypothetical protein